MVSLEDFNAVKDLTISLNQQIQALTLQVAPDHVKAEEENMDILIDAHMRDITSENRPQMSSAGLDVNNSHFKDLSNHELHEIKKMHKKDHVRVPRTILDEPLGEIMNKTVNFMTYSFEGHSKAYTEALLMENVLGDMSYYEMIKVNIIALVLFIRSDQNILYIGILLGFSSIIIYLVNITTS